MDYLRDHKLNNKKVLLRVDLNTPIQNSIVSNDERIVRCLPTIKYILENKGRLTVLSHLGRPKENGIFQPEFSLQPVAQRLGELLGQKINLVAEIKDYTPPAPGNINMLENVRFLEGEKSNTASLSKTFADMCDIYVMDAFATSHRAHASTKGAILLAHQACAGFLLEEELSALSKLNNNESRPAVAVLGGAKISTKLNLINSLADKMDFVILGGGVANTCLAAKGIEIGSSLCERDMLKEALELANKENVILPNKVVVSDSVKGKARIVDVKSINPEDSIFDIAPESFHFIENIFKQAKIILWKGPVGLFEEPQFMAGTASVARMIVSSEGYSVGGGGDTIAAASQLGVLEDINYMSTAGGAFLEYIEGKDLPALEALRTKALESNKHSA
jgi:phosphoglycerate kinase